MKVLRALLIRLVWSGVITASVLPIVLLTVPAVRTDASTGLVVTAGVLTVTFTWLVIRWFRRRA